MPWGSLRDIYISVQPEKLDEVFSFLTRALESRALVLRTEDALSRGLTGRGPLHPQFRSRTGDILVLPDDDLTVWYEHTRGRKFSLLGMHGGLSPDEMLVPLAVAPLDRLV